MSRPPWPALALTTLVVAGGAWWYLGSTPAIDARSDASPEAGSAPGDAVIVSLVVPRPDDATPLTVSYVFDGDTIEAQTPDGATIRVRLIGVDTPEGTPTPECWADQARDDLRRMLPEGATVWASGDVEAYDAYERSLYYLWTDDGTFVNYQLMLLGDAETLSIPPNTTHAGLFADAQRNARSAGLGRWSACRE